MALIGKIRERSGLVLILVGLALVLFLVSDLVKSGSSIFGGGNSRPSGIGKIFGEELSPDEFQYRLNRILSDYQAQIGNDKTIDAAKQDELNDAAWGDLVNEKLMEKEYAGLGIAMSDDEMMELIFGPNPHSFAMQNLPKDSATGLVDRRIKTQLIDQFAKAAPEQKRSWLNFESQFAKIRMNEKYNALVKNAIFTTDIEIQDDFNAKNQFASADVVSVPLRTIDDKTIKIEDADLQAYLDAHKENYKREESRAIEYVTFDVLTKAEDTLTSKQWIEDQVSKFRETKNDSGFVSQGDNGLYPSRFVPRVANFYPPELIDSIYRADSGTILGPYFIRDTFRLVKISATKNDSNYYYHASHVLVKPAGATAKDTADAYAKVQDIMAKVKKGEDFATFALENGDASAYKGGDLGWFTANMMVKPFSDAVKNAKKGDLVIAKTQFGVHLIKVTDNKTNRSVKAALLQKAVVPSAKTLNEMHKLAFKFRGEVDASDFAKAAEKMKLTKKVAENMKPNDRTLPGTTLENPKELIRWVYNSEKGAVSDVKKFGNQFVIARVTKIQEDGYAKVEDIKDELTALVRAEKKKELLAEKLSTAMKSGKNFQQIADELKGSFAHAEQVSFGNDMVNGVNVSDPALVGQILGSPLNKVTGPVKGNEGVYLVKTTKLDAVKTPEKLDEERKMLSAQRAGSAVGSASEALRKMADVKDYRYLFP